MTIEDLKNWEAKTPFELSVKNRLIEELTGNYGFEDKLKEIAQTDPYLTSWFTEKYYWIWLCFYNVEDKELYDKHKDEIHEILKKYPYEVIKFYNEEMVAFYITTGKIYNDLKGIKS